MVSTEPAVLSGQFTDGILVQCVAIGFVRESVPGDTFYVTECLADGTWSVVDNCSSETLQAFSMLSM